MSQHAAFLSAIRENPDDDTPRLAFADWLTENGEAERGEFIRVQVSRSRLPADDPGAERVARPRTAIDTRSPLEVGRGAARVANGPLPAWLRGIRLGHGNAPH